MKFLLINLDNTIKEYEFKEHKIDDMHSLHEFIFNNNKIIKKANNKNGFFNKIKNKLYINRMRVAIYKLLDIDKKTKEKWYYILSNSVLNNMVACKEITDILDSVYGMRYVLTSEIEENIPKYVLEHANNEKINEHEIRVLLVYKNTKNINYSFIEKMIKRYKKVNIYLKEKPTDIVLSEIDKINKDNGSFVEIIKYNKKAFMEYNVVYFVQDLRINYPRLRLGKNALVIDDELVACDKYNSNIIFLKQLRLDENVVENLNKQYGIIDIAYAVRKIVN